MVDDVLRALRDCVGRRLDRVEATVHTHPAGSKATITHVSFDLGDRCVCLGTVGHGGLQLTAPAPTTDMGGFGRIERRLLDFAAVGEPLRSVRRVLSSEPGPELDSPVGVALEFASGQIWIWNCADDLEAADVAPGQQQTNAVRSE